METTLSRAISITDGGLDRRSRRTGVIAKAQATQAKGHTSYSGAPQLKGELSQSGDATMQAEQSLDALEAELV